MKKEELSLINFTDLNKEQESRILTWRNNTNVRKWMYTSESITNHNHQIFIEMLKTDTTKQYYLVLKNSHEIGVIYFTNIDLLSKQANFGIYSNPLNKGNGKSMMHILKNYGFNTLQLHTLTAEVFQENTIAYSLYINTGFKEIKTTLIKEQNIIQMELKNENR